MIPDHAEAIRPHSEALRASLETARHGYITRTRELCPVCAAQEFISRLFDEALRAGIAAGASPGDMIEMLCDAWNARMMEGKDEVHH